MFFSKYVNFIKLEDSDETILHQKYNGAVYLIKTDTLNYIFENQFKGLKDISELNDLIDYQFLVNQEINPVTIRQCNEFLVTIEMSSQCNLRCSYCYQHDPSESKRDVISTDNINNIYSYIENVFLKNPDFNLDFGIIGGEPLLHLDLVTEIIRRIRDLANHYNRSCFVHVDTNGTIDFSDLYNEFPNIRFSVSLSLPEDHNVNRAGFSFNSFELVYLNLKRIMPLPHRRISVRYNTNDKNIDNFDQFIKFCRENLPAIDSIVPMYTDCYEFNDFQNDLSNNDFRIWNSTKAIDILLNSRYPVNYSLSSNAPNTCIAYQPYSCKIYADGRVTLCDSMPPSQSNLYVAELVEDVESVNRYFERYKSYDATQDPYCQLCTDLTLCMGRLFCRANNPCDYNKRFNYDYLLKTYVKYIKQGETLLII